MKSISEKPEFKIDRKVGALIGFNSGVICGLTMGIIMALLIVTRTIPVPPVLAVIPQELLPILAVGIGILVGMVFGTIIGIIFISAYEILPGKSPSHKGVILALTLWVLFLLSIPLQLFILFPFGAVNLALSISIFEIANLLTYTFFGALLGHYAGDVMEKGKYGQHSL